MRALPGQWRDRFGYTPLLAESASPIRRPMRGTCYKASNWEAVGYSSAATAAIGADFYLPNDRPNAALAASSFGARRGKTLRAAQLPEECRAGFEREALGHAAGQRPTHVESLLEVFWESGPIRARRRERPLSGRIRC
ncbi:DUF4338 domain-containing protein [Verrucomicrobium sp. 3C]|uniref:DUF4338 domain-containing protein n=1 Tax=Verrucomicrobium sp. 3C TaxID=1134055 RepID=UPI001E4D3AA5|nr:DUF4338 domain-containing protein [Verrucomicrobium sp. 3C]